MTAIMPFTTALLAAGLGLLGVALTVNVILNRVRARADVGDGGDARLAQAIRAHANFAEQGPLGLIVIGFAEALGTRALIVQVLAGALVVARLASAYGLNRTLKQSPPRQFGAGLTALVIALSAVAILLALAGIEV